MVALAVPAAAVAGSTTSTAVAVLYGLALAGVAAAALAVLARRDEASLREAAARLQDLADGRVVRRPAAARAGLVGSLDVATSRVAETLHAALTELDRSVSTLEHHAHSVNEVALAMGETSEGSIVAAASAARSADDVSMHMQMIAAATEELAATIREVSRHAVDASQTATTSSQEVLGAASTVAQLRSASTAIEDVVKLIGTIAAQTQILALNAGIEAARAGQHGQGFAVVAAEVKALARQTATATERVTGSVHEIDEGSGHVAEAMDGITVTITRVTDNQQAIAAAVEQQTATTASIGASAADAAGKASELAGSVKSLTDAVRRTAYTSAQARTAAAELGQLERSVRGFLTQYTFERAEAAVEEAVDPRETGVVRAGTRTTVEDYVMGTGLNEWDYAGTWGHATTNLEADGSNAHSCMPDDTATIRFVGTRARFFTVTADNHGKIGLSIDGGEETVVDTYSPQRHVRVMCWESPVLERGEHVFRCRVLGEGNEQTRYFWINVDAVEIED